MYVYIIYMKPSQHLTSTKQPHSPSLDNNDDMSSELILPAFDEACYVELDSKDREY